MKRTREVIAGIDMAKMILLLSRGSVETKFKKCSSSPNHVFECKTCNRQFPSFQALGGHSASHKGRRKLTGSDQEPKTSETNMSKPKLRHECSICELVFSSGQALGGHMRRHRITPNAEFSSSVPAADAVACASRFPVLMRSNSKRVMCLDMDLNLTPLENDLRLLFGNTAPKLDTFIS